MLVKQGAQNPKDGLCTVVIPYYLYEISPFMTAGYITVGIPGLMDKLSPAIWGVLGGKTTARDAIECVKTTILSGEWKCIKAKTGFGLKLNQ